MEFRITTVVIILLREFPMEYVTYNGCNYFT